MAAFSKKSGGRSAAATEARPLDAAHERAVAGDKVAEEGPKCPRCPSCGIAAGMPGPGKITLVCGACGLLWRGSRAAMKQARAAADAFEAQLAAELAAEHERREAVRDRERAIEMFRAAGKPVPAWLQQEGER